MLYLFKSCNGIVQGWWWNHQPATGDDWSYTWYRA